MHLVAVCVVGRTSGQRLNAASVITAPVRMLHVDLVKDPLSEPKPRPEPTPAPKPVPVAVPQPIHNAPHQISRALTAMNLAPIPSPIRPSSPAFTPHAPVRTASPYHAPAPGGALSTGTASSHGDLPGMGNGRTPVGWVAGSDHGTGIGSGSAPGVGRPEPPRNIEEPHHPAPPPPPPPPAPKRISVKICVISGMVAGEYCKNTRTETYTEGEEPKRICDKCKAPEPEHHSRLADRENPVLTHDVQPSIPDSVDEGLNLSVEIEYWVDTDGSVDGVKVTKSSGNRELDRSVVSTASRWKYNPAVQDGTARRVKVTRTIRFRT